MKTRFWTVLGLSMLLAACEQPMQAVTIQFAAVNQSAPIDCETAKTRLTDLRFYVHDVQLINTAGNAVPLVLTEDGQRQSQTVALLDFENGTGACRNGSPQTYTQIVGHVPAAEYQGLSFRIGVPFELNHQNPVQAKPPLNYSTMHWHWQAGYKFMRVGVQANDARFWFHLGSTGCQGTVSNVTGCLRGNRPLVEFERFHVEQDKVLIDLAALLENVDITQHQKCMSDAQNQACAGVFAVLGLDDMGDAKHSAPLFTTSHHATVATSATPQARITPAIMLPPPVQANQHQ